MFEEYKGLSLVENQVVSELEKIQNLGWCISVEKSNKNKYRINVNEFTEIVIYPSKDYWVVSGYNKGTCFFHKKPRTIEQFIENINLVGTSIGCDFNIKNDVKSVRVKESEPFSNKVKLVSLVDKNKISDIFDPYFNTESLLTLYSLIKLGVSFSKNVRCITKLSLNNIDNNVLNDFNVEYSINFQIKKGQKNEHRRFIVLDNSKVIILGCSLNNIDKNEAFYEELDLKLAKEDIIFFNDKWKIL
jgi:hypothetical protein